jgi:hypothetical protein
MIAVAATFTTTGLQRHVDGSTILDYPRGSMAGISPNSDHCCFSTITNKNQRMTAVDRFGSV